VASIVIEGIVRDGKRVLIERSDGLVTEIAGGLPELKQWIASQVREANGDLIVALGLARWLKQNPNPTAADIPKIVGKTITFDLSAARILEVT
jgi:hypothetical protein